jgi:hypothetical protein
MIPKRLAKRPLWNGYVIPYTVQVDANGIPQFRMLDEKLRQKCLKWGLCGICGEQLDKNIVCFIGGEACCQYKHFIDPGMHKECAEYAATNCPYLKGTKRLYNENPTRMERDGEVKAVATFGNKERPKRMAIFYTKHWKAEYYIENGHKLLHAVVKDFFKTDWKIMPESTPLEKE